MVRRTNEPVSTWMALKLWKGEILMLKRSMELHLRSRKLWRKFESGIN